MTTPSIGQRLKAWRLANGFNEKKAAVLLDLTLNELCIIEHAYVVNIHPSIQERIEALIAPPGHSAIVEAATAAIKAGLDSGATVVRIVRCATPTSGRVVVIIGDDPEWRDAT